MRIDIFIYRWHDPDLVMLHEAGYSLGRLTTEAVSAYAHGKNIKIDVSEALEHALPLSGAKKYRYAAIFDDSDTVTTGLIKHILPRFKSAFCKTVLRNSLSALMTGGFFKDMGIVPQPEGGTRIIGLDEFRRGMRRPRTKEAQAVTTDRKKPVRQTGPSFMRDGHLQADTGPGIQETVQEQPVRMHDDTISAYTAAHTVDVIDSDPDTAQNGNETVSVQSRQEAASVPEQPLQAYAGTAQPVEEKTDDVTYIDGQETDAGSSNAGLRPAGQAQPDEADDEGIVYVDDDGSDENMSEAELLDAFDKL